MRAGQNKFRFTGKVTLHYTLVNTGRQHTTGQSDSEHWRHAAAATPF